MEIKLWTRPRFAVRRACISTKEQAPCVLCGLATHEKHRVTNREIEFLSVFDSVFFLKHISLTTLNHAQRDTGADFGFFSVQPRRRVFAHVSECLRRQTLQRLRPPSGYCFAQLAKAVTEGRKPAVHGRPHLGVTWETACCFGLCKLTAGCAAPRAASYNPTWTPVIAFTLRLIVRTFS